MLYGHEFDVSPTGLTGWCPSARPGSAAKAPAASTISRLFPGMVGFGGSRPPSQAGGGGDRGRGRGPAHRCARMDTATVIESVRKTNRLVYRRRKTGAPWASALRSCAKVTGGRPSTIWTPRRPGSTRRTCRYPTLPTWRRCPHAVRRDKTCGRRSRFPTNDASTIRPPLRSAPRKRGPRAFSPSWVGGGLGRGRSATTKTPGSPLSG